MLGAPKGRGIERRRAGELGQLTVTTPVRRLLLGVPFVVRARRYAVQRGRCRASDRGPARGVAEAMPDASVEEIAQPSSALPRRDARFGDAPSARVLSKGTAVVASETKTRRRTYCDADGAHERRPARPRWDLRRRLDPLIVVPTSWEGPRTR